MTFQVVAARAGAASAPPQIASARVAPASNRTTDRIMCHLRLLALHRSIQKPRRHGAAYRTTIDVVIEAKTHNVAQDLCRVPDDSGVTVAEIGLPISRRSSLLRIS